MAVVPCAKIKNEKLVPTKKDGTGLGEYLHNDPKFPACLARKLYSYATGMDSEDVSAANFKTAYKSFTDSGYRMRALIKGLAASPDFYNVGLKNPVSPSR